MGTKSIKLCCASWLVQCLLVHNFSMSDGNFSCFAANLSRESVTEVEWMPASEDSKESIWIISSMLLVFAAVGIPLNIGILLVLVRQKFYKEPSSFLLFNLGLLDLLSCVMFIPFLVVPGLFGGEYVIGSSDFQRCLACYSGSMIILLLVLVSWHLLALMSIDRLLYIQKPLHYDRTVTVPRLSVAIAVIWVLCIVLVLPPAFQFGDIRYADSLATCTPSISSQTPLGRSYIYLFSLILECLVPLFILIAANVSLIWVLRRESKKRLEITTEHSNSSSECNLSAKRKYSEQQIRMVKMFGSIFMVNFVTWAPAVLLIIISTSLGFNKFPPGILGLTYLSFLSQTVVHPIMETFLVARMRQLAKKFLLNFFCCCRIDSRANGRPNRNF